MRPASSATRTSSATSTSGPTSSGPSARSSSSSTRRASAATSCLLTTRSPSRPGPSPLGGRRLRARYPLVDDGSRDVELLRLIHEPEVTPAELAEAYPAHLHIDLLERARGRGLGRLLIERLLGELRARGVPGVHLGVDATTPTPSASTSTSVSARSAASRAESSWACDWSADRARGRQHSPLPRPSALAARSEPLQSVKDEVEREAELDIVVAGAEAAVVGRCQGHLGDVRVALGQPSRECGRRFGVHLR